MKPEVAKCDGFGRNGVVERHFVDTENGFRRKPKTQEARLTYGCYATNTFSGAWCLLRSVCYRAIHTTAVEIPGNAV
jgi:hypothetical protein